MRGFVGAKNKNLNRRGRRFSARITSYNVCYTKLLRVPFDSAEADVFLKGGIFRVRKVLASGPSVQVALSGEWDGGRRAADLQGSGEVDIGGWMASGAPGGDWLRRVATEGKLTFSAQWRGSPESPEGSVKILTRNLVRNNFV